MGGVGWGSAGLSTSGLASQLSGFDTTAESHSAVSGHADHSVTLLYGMCYSVYVQCARLWYLNLRQLGGAGGGGGDGSIFPIF